jgi:hypothetical protein
LRGVATDSNEPWLTTPSKLTTKSRSSRRTELSSETVTAGAPTRTARRDPRPEANPEWWSVQRKTALVLRLLSGESLDAIAWESQIPAHELLEWLCTYNHGGIL